MSMYFLYLVVAVWVCVDVWSYFFWRKKVKAGEEALKREKKLANELFESADERVALLQTEIMDWRCKYNSLKDELEEQMKKNLQYLQTNEELQNQREEAWRLYYDQAAMAGNAQDLLFRNIERLLVELNRYREAEGKSPRALDFQIREVMEDFKETHLEKRIDA